MSDVFQLPKGIFMKSPADQRKALTAAVAASALVCGPALADSQYGSATATGASVSASAHVKLQVTVATMILLRVGASTGDGDTLTWVAGLDTSSPIVDNNHAYDWSGGAARRKISGNTEAFNVANASAAQQLMAYAWTNASGGGALSYTATPFDANGPALADISVTAATESVLPILNHPGPATLAASSTESSKFLANSIASANWTYTLAGAPESWAPGAHNSTITYTATSL